MTARELTDGACDRPLADRYPTQAWVPPENRATRHSLVDRLTDLLNLSKARVNLLVVGTVFVGFALSGQILSNWQILLSTLVGTGLVAGAAAVANQILEVQFDRRMIRTRNRPLAAGRIRRKTAFVLSAALLAVGCLGLGGVVNMRVAGLAALTFAVYVFAYTPLKRKTPVCILVGAVAGALPLLIGWVASGATLDLWIAVAFAILFLWQIPHFLAIAWRWKSDYLRAGYRVLPCGDTNGIRTAGWAFAGVLAMVTVTILPLLLLRPANWLLVGELLLGVGMIIFAARFLSRRTAASARILFIATLVYLPCTYFLMLLFKARV